MSEKIYFYDGSLKESLDILPNRSLFFGEGVFETFRYKSQIPIYIDRHLKRLKKGSEFLQISIPSDDIIIEFIKNSVQEAGLDDAYVKICLFSSGGNSYYDKSQRYILCSVIKEYPHRKSDISLTIATECINSKSELNYYKTINYIQNKLSKRQAISSGFEEALFLNEKGNVTECTAHNIFWIKDSKIYTPSLKNGLLPGITRSVIIDICNDLDLELIEGDYDIKELQRADYIFLTNAISGIVKVYNMEGKEYLEESQIYKNIEDNLLTRLMWK